MLLLSEADLRSIAGYADIPAAADVLAAAYVAAAERGALEPVRVVMRDSAGGEGSGFRAQFSLQPHLGVAATRVIGVPARRSVSTRRDPRGLVLLYDTEQMRLQAILANRWLHVVRTAAPTALALRFLKPPETRVLGLLGSGPHARGQVAAACAELRPCLVRVFSPTPEHRRSFCTEMAATLGQEMEAVEAAQHAVRGADVVILCTSSTSPVISGDWLQPRVLLVAIGRGEVDSGSLEQAECIVTDHLDHILDEEPAPQRLRAFRESGRLAAEQWLSLGQLVANPSLTDRARGKLTLFLCSGSALQDVAINAWAYERARQLGLGQETDYLAE